MSSRFEPKNFPVIDMQPQTAPNDYPEFLRFLGRHLVVLGVNYIVLEEEKKETGEEHFLAYTCTVVTNRDRWFLVTAGHVVEELERLVSMHQIKILKQN